MKNKNNHNFRKIKTFGMFCLYFVFVVAAFCILFLEISRAATADATLFFNPSSTSVAVGSDFNLVARVNPGSNTVDGINAVQLDVTFDPDVLQLSSVTAAAPFTIMGSATINNTDGTLLVTLFIGGSDVTTTSDVATLAFHAEAAGTSSPVAFAGTANAAANDGSGTLVVETRTSAAVTVVGEEETYTIGGTISGLSGTVVLQNNAGDNLTQSANGSFTFATALHSSDTYNVIVSSQPNGQTCAVSNGTGTVASGNITSVSITCSNNSDTTDPVVTAFTIPATADSLAVDITTLTATDVVGVTGYLLTESASTPDADDSDWSGTAQIEYTFLTEGSKTLYAWAKDAAGNVSESLDDSVTITLPTDDEDDEDDDDDIDRGSKNYKLYEYYKEKYHNKSSREVYIEVKALKKSNPQTFEGMKALYKRFKNWSDRERNAYFWADWKEMFSKYKKYNGYRNYKIYRDKVGL